MILYANVMVYEKVNNPLCMSSGLGDLIQSSINYVCMTGSQDGGKTLLSCKCLPV